MSSRKKVYRKSEGRNIHEFNKIENAEMFTANQELKHDSSSSNIQELVFVVIKIDHFN